MTDTSRVGPPLTGLDEREMLRAWLDYHRATLVMKCDGLTDEQLCQRSCAPSSLSLLGLLQHMTEVERGWFQRTFAGAEAEPLYYSDAEPDGDFDTLAPDGVAAVRELYATTLETARRIEAQAPTLDTDGALVREDRGPVSLRWIMVHMIEEYARHNGHADLLRERIDGTTGE
ncbi:MAG: DinB family protein [Actinomycetota bacterium]|nr:DinB family protein [Actinomycetota bacterium]